MSLKSSLALFLILIYCSQSRRINTNQDCNHYYDYPIDICFSVNSTRTGLKSFRYTCNTTTTENPSSGEPEQIQTVLFKIYNNSHDCSNDQINTTIVYNITTDKDLNITNPFISCDAAKTCPYFKGRYYITKILTASPTSDPTQYPSTDPTPTPTDYPTATNGTRNPSPDPTHSPTLEPTTASPTLPSAAPSITLNTTYAPSINPTSSPIDFAPYFPNETCARSDYGGTAYYYQDIIYVIDTCLPYKFNKSTGLAANGEGVSMYGNNVTNLLRGENITGYLTRKCDDDEFGVPLSISSALFTSFVLFCMVYFD